MKQITELNAWTALEHHAQSMRLTSISELKNSSTCKANNLKLGLDGLCIDFTNQRINESSLNLLTKLAEERQLKNKIEALFQGQKVNQSENRPALHTALRILDEKPIMVDGFNIVPAILATRKTMRDISDQIRAQRWLGYSGKAISSIVNIGIGGSDFGPRFCIESLADYTANHLNYHFISDADPKAFEKTLAKLHPETTLFIVSSKSFTTEETILNANKAIAWFGAIDQNEILEKHFIAVTANEEKAKQFGIQLILPLWDWVGGRYSLCSAINLICCIAIGYNHFMDLLAGANNVDQHFRHSELEKNIPVILALIGIWNINFLHMPSLLMLVYTKQLELLVPYVQQLDMESNGKSIDTLGRAVNHATGPIIWGGLGNQAQHSYYQLLCQGTHRIAVDIITTKEFDGEIVNDICNEKVKVLSEGTNPTNNANGYIPGSVPINHIQLDSCSPFCIGSLIAIFEHKIYVQSVLWNINSFDQPGVESAKRVKMEKLKKKIPADDLGKSIILLEIEDADFYAT